MQGSEPLLLEHIQSSSVLFSLNSFSDALEINIKKKKKKRFAAFCFSRAGTLGSIHVPGTPVLTNLLVSEVGPDAVFIFGTLIHPPPCSDHWHSHFFLVHK